MNDAPNEKKKFSLADLESADTADLEIYDPVTGEGTGWIFTLAGPSHQKSVALSEANAAKNARRQQMIEQAQINGKKYKAPSVDLDDERRHNIAGVAARVVTWRGHPEGLPFSDDECFALLMQRNKDKIFSQLVEYLIDERAFMTRSAMT